MVELVFYEEVPGLSSEFFLKWFQTVCVSENQTLGEVSLVLGGDDWLLEKNKEYLNHDYLTDIITFDYSGNGLISGDLLISVDRVKENAMEYDVSFMEELNRVCVHGLLHLLGYKDDTESNKKIMRNKENHYLGIL